MTAKLYSPALTCLAVAPLCLVAWVWISTAMAGVEVRVPYHATDASPVWLEFESPETPAASSTSQSDASAEATPS